MVGIGLWYVLVVIGYQLFRELGTDATTDGTIYYYLWALPSWGFISAINWIAFAAVGEFPLSWENTMIVGGTASGGSPVADVLLSWLVEWPVYVVVVSPSLFSLSVCLSQLHRLPELTLLLRSTVTCSSPTTSTRSSP